MTDVRALLAAHMSEAEPVIRQELALPFHPKAVLNGSQGNRWARARERRWLRETVAVLARDLRPLFGPVRVTVEWHTAMRRRIDADNVLARCKSAFDALVDIGILQDDNVDVIGTPTVVAVPDGVNAVLIVLEQDARGGAGVTRPTTTNRHGIEGAVYGRQFVPLVCVSCPFRESESDDMGGNCFTYCARNVYMPTRKGTCAVRERAERGEAG